mmetsp:Transcript_43115/g.131339  ORF Transcript_43115/g.131339 Transcript_43115/m.131339 type:complete len:251 (-) Transcript_43115:451-1203(-)
MERDAAGGGGGVRDAGLRSRARLLEEEFAIIVRSVSAAPRRPVRPPRVDPSRRRRRRRRRGRGRGRGRSCPRSAGQRRTDDAGDDQHGHIEGYDRQPRRGGGQGGHTRAGHIRGSDVRVEVDLPPGGQPGHGNGGTNTTGQPRRRRFVSPSRLHEVHPIVQPHVSRGARGRHSGGGGTGVAEGGGVRFRVGGPPDTDVLDDTVHYVRKELQREIRWHFLGRTIWSLMSILASVYKWGGEFKCRENEWNCS